MSLYESFTPYFTLLGVELKGRMKGWLKLKYARNFLFLSY